MRVLEQGTETTGAPPAVFLAGMGGVPRWLPFLDRLSENRRVIVPSLAGFPGAEAFRHLDSLYDWIVDAVEMFEALDLPSMDLIGSSVGGALAAETAAIAGGRIRRLVLVAPFGLFDEDEPNADIWAQIPAPDVLAALVCADPERWKTIWETPEDADAVEWQIAQTRSMEAAARFLFPFGETGVAKRLHRIVQPTLARPGRRRPGDPGLLRDTVRRRHRRAHPRSRDRRRRALGRTRPARGAGARDQRIPLRPGTVNMAIEATLWDIGGVLTSSPFEAFNRFEAAHDLPTDFIRTVNSTNPRTNAWAQFEASRVSADEFDALFRAESTALGHPVSGKAVLELLSGPDPAPHDRRPRPLQGALQGGRHHEQHEAGSVPPGTAQPGADVGDGGGDGALRRRGGVERRGHPQARPGDLSAGMRAAGSGPVSVRVLG